MWPKYLSLATFTYNTFNSPNLENYSHMNWFLERNTKMLLNLETTPDTKVSGIFKDFHK